ncbi:hypothetical protein Tco_0360253, partial [Tanacetum coccineum]
HRYRVSERQRDKNRRSSKRAGEELKSENLRKQKLDENVETEVDDDQEEAEMKRHMEIVPDDEMLQNIDREDLETLWKLVKAKHGGVHFVRFQNLHILMLVEKRYPLTPETITEMLNKKLQADHWNEMCYQLLKLKTKQLKNPGNV